MIIVQLDIHSGTILEFKIQEKIELTDSEMSQSTSLKLKKQTSPNVEQINNNGISRIFVVSDDIRWIKENHIFKDKIFFHVEKLDELETMDLMSLCKGGAIC